MSKLSALAAVAAFALAAAAGEAALGHENHGTYSAGAPGDPKKPARVVKVSMREEGTKMLYEPARIEVRRGEQIRFVVSNDGIFNHEFVLATVAENRKHGELMKKYPDMEHEDPNAITVAPYAVGEVLWKFTRKGEFEFACLLPDHYEAGMHGTIFVK